MLRTTSLLMRVLNVLNWIGVALFGFLLIATFAAADHFLQGAARALPHARSGELLLAIRLLCCIVLVVGPPAHLVFTRLGAILRTVEVGDPFVAANGRRLRTIGWAMLVMQVVDLIFGYVALRVTEQTGEYFGWSFSLGGWIAALLIFVLAEVWTQGAAMRDDLQGTV